MLAATQLQEATAVALTDPREQMIPSRRDIQNLSSQLNHDLPEPINSIRRKLEILEALAKRQASPKAGIKEYIENTRAQCNAILNQIKSLRNDVLSDNLDTLSFGNRLDEILQASSRLSAIASRTPHFPAAENVLSQIRAAASRYQKMLKALLTMFSTEDPNFQQTNFRNHAGIAAGYVRERFASRFSNQDFDSVFFWNETRASGLADQGMILTILQNIYENAIKYRHPHRQLKVSTSFHELEAEELKIKFPTYFHLVPKAPAYVVISIEDNGVGIPADSQQKIFDAYVQLPTNHRASSDWSSEVEDDEKDIGIGLYTVRKLVAAHRGYVLVQSDGHSGSTFHIILPQDPKTAMSD